jgi:transposase-like protein
MTVLEIQAHLQQMHGAVVSPRLISTVTDTVINDCDRFRAFAPVFQYDSNGS